MSANIPVYQQQQTGALKSTLGGGGKLSVVATVTLAQLNAGYTIVEGLVGRQIRVLGYYLKCNGAFTTLATGRISDTADSPVDVASFTQATMTDGAEFSSDMTITGQTKGAGWLANLTVDKGVQLRAVGGTAAGGTSILVRIDYEIN